MIILFTFYLFRLSQPPSSKNAVLCQFLKLAEEPKQNERDSMCIECWTLSTKAYAITYTHIHRRMRTLKIEREREKNTSEWIPDNQNRLYDDDDANHYKTDEQHPRLERFSQCIPLLAVNVNKRRSVRKRNENEHEWYIFTRHKIGRLI